jgi:hypothetical protein
MAEEISKQPSIQATVWVLLADFSQIYNENHELEGFKNLQFAYLKRSQVLYTGTIVKMT